MAWKRRWAAYAAAMTMIASVLSAVAAVPAAATPVAPPSLVDDGVYPYPDAAAILAEQNVELISGDGHIVLADCATPPVGDIGLLKVFTTDETIGADGIGRICFTINASSGVLNLRVPGVYEIRGDGQRTGTGHEVTAELHSDDGQDLTVAVDPDGSTQVGLGTDPNASPTMLLQLYLGTGPAPVTGSQTAVGKIASADRMCTATLVTSRWILTAASCFSTDPLQLQAVASAPAEPTYAVFPGHAAVAVSWLSPRTGRDVLLARLATPITDITPLALATSVAATGVTLSAFGFGRTTQWVTDQQQSPQITFTASTASSLSAGSGPLVCAGMAGAPVIASGTVAAVLTRAGQAGCLGVTGADSSITAERTDDLALWFTTVTTTTADHTWTLADMPAGAGSGSAITTPVADDVYSGTGSPMTAGAGARWVTGDTYSPAVELDGVQGRLAGSVAPLDTSKSFTASIWVKPAASGTVLSQNGSNAAALRIWRDSSDGSWRFGMSRSDTANPVWDIAAGPAGSASLGAWTQLTVTFDKPTSKISLYAKGVLLAVAAHTSTWTAAGGMHVGDYRTSSAAFGNAFGGRVSRLQTWNTAGQFFDPAAVTLKGQWDLNETSGTTAADASGNNRTGTLSGGVSWVSGGYKSGDPGSASFNGSTATITTANVVDTASSFSVSMWAYNSDTSAVSYRTALVQQGPNYAGFFVQKTGDRWSFGRSKSATDSTITRALSTSTVPLNTWTHLVGVYDAANGQLRLYVNGSLQASASCLCAWASTGSLFIGRTHWPTQTDQEYWLGRLDGVRVYQGVLTDAQVLGLGEVTPAALKGQWDLNETSGTTAADASGNNRTGTLSGGVSWVSGGYKSGDPGSASFNGSNGTITTSNAVNTASSFSVSMWAYNSDTSTSSYRTALVQQGPNYAGFFVQKTGDRWSFGRSKSATDITLSRALSTSTIALNTWTHLVGVYDAANGQLRLYVNGNLQATTPCSCTWASTGNLLIGRTYWPPQTDQEYWLGRLDAVRVYQGVLTQAQIAAL